MLTILCEFFIIFVGYKIIGKTILKITGYEMFERN